MLSAVPEWTGLETNNLLLVPTAPVFAYYSNPVLNGPFRTSIFTIACTELAVCASIQLMTAATADIPGTFNCDSNFVSSTPCLIGVSLTLSFLI